MFSKSEVESSSEKQPEGINFYPAEMKPILEADKEESVVESEYVNSKYMREDSPDSFRVIEED